MGLAESLLAEFGLNVQSLTLIPSRGGVFDVRVGEDLVFSKHQAGRFPANEDMKAQVRQRLKG